MRGTGAATGIRQPHAQNDVDPDLPPSNQQASSAAAAVPRDVSTTTCRASTTPHSSHGRFETQARAHGSDALHLQQPSPLSRETTPGDVGRAAEKRAVGVRETPSSDRRAVTNTRTDKLSISQSAAGVALRPERRSTSHLSTNSQPPPSSQAQSSTPCSRLTSFAPNPSAKRMTFFDPWNSSSTGHQRAENRLSGSTSWRQSRSLKLGEQYKGGLTGGKRVADTVGEGSEDFGKDGRKADGGWEKGAKGLRGAGQKSLVELWGAKVIKSASSSQEKDERKTGFDAHDSIRKDEDAESTVKTPEKKEKQIFQGLCFYLNGSTAPLISDHKLKHLLAAHGGSLSIALGRRTVTHVIVAPTAADGGCGGGLAATKMQKEIAQTRGKGVKFVGAEWILASIAAGKRLPEARYAPLKLAPKAQGSVYGLFRAATKDDDASQSNG